MTGKLLLIIILGIMAAAALALGAACYMEAKEGGCKVASFAYPLSANAADKQVR